MTQDLSGKNTVVTVTKGGQCEGQHGNTSGARGFATPGKPHTDEVRAKTENYFDEHRR